MFRTLIALAIAWSTFAPATPSSPPTPPMQPETGPGGSDYRFEQVDAEHVGVQPTGYWLFRPATFASTGPLPVVVFLHGFSAVNPETYRAWIDHVVRRGAVVIYPDYQTADLTETSSADYQANAIAGIEAALVGLDSEAAGTVDLSQIVLVGHSLGAVLALNIAALGAELGFPEVSAVMAVEPGGCAQCGGISVLIGLPYEDLSDIPSSARAVVMVGDADDVAGNTGAKVAWARLASVPLDRRDYVVLHSDRWGQPALIADHYAPEASADRDQVDAMDWYGTWKFLDLLTDCAFRDVECSDALGGSSAQLDMGKWSDGRPVESPTITDSP